MGGRPFLWLLAGVAFAVGPCELDYNSGNWKFYLGTIVYTITSWTSKENVLYRDCTNHQITVKGIPPRTGSNAGPQQMIFTIPAPTDDPKEYLLLGGVENCATVRLVGADHSLDVQSSSACPISGPKALTVLNVLGPMIGIYEAKLLDVAEEARCLKSPIRLKIRLSALYMPVYKKTYYEDFYGTKITPAGDNFRDCLNVWRELVTDDPLIDDKLAAKFQVEYTEGQKLSQYAQAALTSIKSAPDDQTCGQAWGVADLSVHLFNAAAAKDNLHCPRLDFGQGFAFKFKIGKRRRHHI